MSQATICCLIIALVLSLTRAPFTHLHAGHDHHADEPEHEHLALAFHTHVETGPSSAHHDNEPEIAPAKASAKAQTLSFFHLRPQTSPPLPILTDEGPLLSPLVWLISKVSEPPPRAHDPPFAFPSIPRSPPV